MVPANGCLTAVLADERTWRSKYLGSPQCGWLSCTRPDDVPQSYIRYLSNNLREAFDMPGVPIRISLHASENPFAGRARKRT